MGLILTGTYPDSLLLSSVIDGGIRKGVFPETLATRSEPPGLCYNY